MYCNSHKLPCTLISMTPFNLVHPSFFKWHHHDVIQVHFNQRINYLMLSSKKEWTLSRSDCMKLFFEWQRLNQLKVAIKSLKL